MVRSKLSSLEGTHFPVLVVGGGIVGSGLFRDLSLHGVPSLIIDKKDFSSQTSAASSKMLHGGIRYLENLDLPLVWEALHEKNLWLRLAPHLCYEESFTLPVFKGARRPLFMIRAGLTLYDFLSSFQNKPHKILNKAQTLERIPQLQKSSLVGAGLYHDAIMDDVKMGLECIYEGLELEGSEALNHVALVTLEQTSEGYVAGLKDELTGDEASVKCDSVVFATGPFTDQVMTRFLGDKWSPCILPSRGAHIWLEADKIAIKNPMVITRNDGRVIFVNPEKGAILVGTTEMLAENDYTDLKALDEEIDYLLASLKEFFPEIDFSRNDVISSFAGVRPLVKEEGQGDLGKTAREHKVFQPQKNMHVIMGGKYTTFRTMVQEVARELVLRNQGDYCQLKTKKPFARTSVVRPFEGSSIDLTLVKRMVSTELPRTLEDLVKRRIGFHAGHTLGTNDSMDEFYGQAGSFLEETFGSTKDEFASLWNEIIRIDN